MSTPGIETWAKLRLRIYPTSSYSNPNYLNVCKTNLYVNPETFSIWSFNVWIHTFKLHVWRTPNIHLDIFKVFEHVRNLSLNIKFLTKWGMLFSLSHDAVKIFWNTFSMTIISIYTQRLPHSGVWVLMLDDNCIFRRMNIYGIYIWT